MNIEKNDTVTHKIGGPQMRTIVVDDVMKTAVCEWFDEHKCYHRETFDIQDLTKIDRSRSLVFGSIRRS